LYNRSSSLYVIQDFEDIVSTLKTNLFSKFLNSLNINSGSKVLLIYDSNNDKLNRVCRNIRNLKLVNFTELNPRSLLSSDYIVCDSATLQKVEDTYAS